MKVEWRRLALTSSQSARHRIHGGAESLPSVGGGLSSTERKCGEKTNYGKIGEYRMIQIADSFHERGLRSSLGCRRGQRESCEDDVMRG